MTDTLWLSRRRFLKVMAGTAGALVVGIGSVRADEPPVPLGLLGDAWSQVGPYLRIDADGRIFIGARDPDNGEGTATSLPRLIAEELDADWTRVVVVPLGLGVEDGNGEPRWLYGRQRSGQGGILALRPGGSVTLAQPSSSLYSRSSASRCSWSIASRDQAATSPA